MFTEYDKLNPLTNEERQYIYPYTLAGIAMELLGAYSEKHIKGNNDTETEFWMNLGRNGLKAELAQYI